MNPRTQTRLDIPILRVLAAASLALAAAATLGAWDQGVRRGTPQRAGRGWVENADCSVPVREGGRLVLRTDFGSILVKVGASGRMDCQVRLEAYSHDAAEALVMLKGFDLSVRAAEGGASITGRAGGGRHRSSRMNAQYLIAVPLRFNLDMETQGGDVEVQKLQGELRARTAGGDVRTGDIAGPVRVETQGGSIALGNMGQRLEATTAGGSIRVGDVGGDAELNTSGGEIVAGRINGKVQAETAGGDILLRGASGAVVAETAGGQIQIGDCGASVSAETAGGNILLDGARGLVKAETAGGSIDLFKLQSAVRAASAAGPILAEFAANRQTFEPSHIETSVGDVRVYLPPDLPLNIVAVIDQAQGHKISSEFPFIVQGNPQQEFGTVRGRCLVNGGGKELSIHAVTGNIEIHRLNTEMRNQLRKQTTEMNWERQQRLMEQELRQVQQKIEQEMQRQQQELRRQLQKAQQDDDDN